MTGNAQNQSGLKDTIFEKMEFNHSVEEIDPPPPNYLYKYQRIEDWLTAICNNSKPLKKISSYNIGLFESDENIFLTFVGTNTKTLDKYHIETHIDFIPADTYFKLSKPVYNNLTRDAILNKLILEIIEFTKTQKFKRSFLAASNEIIFETTGKVIWKKE